MIRVDGQTWESSCLGGRVVGFWCTCSVDNYSLALNSAAFFDAYDTYRLLQYWHELLASTVGPSLRYSTIRLITMFYWPGGLFMHTSVQY